MADVKISLARLEQDAKWTRWVGISVATGVLAALGYTSFWTIPTQAREKASSAVDAALEHTVAAAVDEKLSLVLNSELARVVPREIDQAVPAAVAAELEARGQIVDAIRTSQDELSDLLEQARTDKTQLANILGQWRERRIPEDVDTLQDDVSDLTETVRTLATGEDLSNLAQQVEALATMENPIASVVYARIDGEQYINVPYGSVNDWELIVLPIAIGARSAISGNDSALADDYWPDTEYRTGFLDRVHCFGKRHSNGQFRVFAKQVMSGGVNDFAKPVDVCCLFVRKSVKLQGTSASDI